MIFYQKLYTKLLIYKKKRFWTNHPKTQRTPYISVWVKVFSVRFVKDGTHIINKSTIWIKKQFNTLPGFSVVFPIRRLGEFHICRRASWGVEQEAKEKKSAIYHNISTLFITLFDNCTLNYWMTICFTILSLFISLFDDNILHYSTITYYSIWSLFTTLFVNYISITLFNHLIRIVIFLQLFHAKLL